MVIYTLGHSTTPIDEFIALLRSHNIEQIVDIRSIPKSRHNPQYMHDALEKSLQAAGIGYVYLRDLGGFRSAQAHTNENEGWHNESFRHYADYMQTADFESGLNKLIDLANNATLAIMCAEAVPWRCHRSLVGDALLVRGITVKDIIGTENVKNHALTSFAVVHGTNITYPAYDEKTKK